MTKTVAPTACRYFGTKRIQSSSPAPITKMAMSRMTRLRLSPKKSANCRFRFTLGSPGVCIQRKARRKERTRAQEFHDRLIRSRRSRWRSSANLLRLGADYSDANQLREQFHRVKRALDR